MSPRANSQAAYLDGVAGAYTRASRHAAGLALALALIAPRPLHAQAAPSGGQAAPSSSATPTDEAQMNTLDDEARQRFQLGRAFYEAGRFGEAAEEFAEAYRLSERPQLLYNLYVANRDAGDWPAAADALRLYLQEVPDAPDRITLRARLQSLDEQVALQKERARADAQRERERRERDQAERIAKPQRSPLPWVVMGAGAALLLSSAVTGALALRAADQLDGVCENDGRLCPSSERDAIERLKALSISTDVLWGVGAAAAVTGLVLRLTGALDARSERPVTAQIDTRPGGLSAALKVRY